MIELMLNPHLQVRPVRSEGRVTAYSLVALVRGRGRLQNTVEVASARPDVIDVLEHMVSGDADVEVDEATWAPLAELGVLVHEHQVARPVRFACRLDAEAEPAASLTVSPDLAILPFADFLARQPGLARILEPCDQIVLVSDPVTGARYPYWIEERERTLLERLVPGAPPPGDLGRTDIRRLACAGILVDAHAVAAARTRVQAAADQLTRSGYAELRHVLPPPQVSALQRYYRDRIAEGHVADRDSQVRLRHAQHNEQLMQYYHHQLRGYFAAVADQPIKPSYGYFAAYRRGAVLAKHTDREQCLLTASLLVDYEAAPPDDPVWPLYLDLPATGESIAICLQPGDCVLYRGCEIPHYRREFRGERSTSFFLHYVDEAFAGSLQ